MTSKQFSEFMLIEIAEQNRDATARAYMYGMLDLAWLTISMNYAVKKELEYLIKQRR